MTVISISVFQKEEHDKEHKTKQKKIKPWIAELGLKEFNKRELVDGYWLTDKHINAVNTLLRKQHPTKAGLQDPAASIAFCFVFPA